MRLHETTSTRRARSATGSGRTRCRFPAWPAFAVAMAACVAGCRSRPSEPQQAPPTLIAKPIDTAELPATARPARLGHVERAYRLESSAPVVAHFALPDGAMKRFLTATLRLFRWDDSKHTWDQLPQTTIDRAKEQLIGKDLTSGLYTAFGWSNNPAENAIQRWVFDAKRGRRGAMDKPVPLDGLKALIDESDVKLVPELVRGWVLWDVTLEQTTCETFARPGCESICGRHSKMLSSCPEECPDRESGSDEPDCCDCEAFQFTERAWLPEDVFEAPFPPCLPAEAGCQVCPEGLSCAPGGDPRVKLIVPTLGVPDYSSLDPIFGRLVEDIEIRDHLHAAVELTLGNEYPVPPPWP